MSAGIHHHRCYTGGYFLDGFSAIYATDDARRIAMQCKLSRQGRLTKTVVVSSVIIELES